MRGGQVCVIGIGKPVIAQRNQILAVGDQGGGRIGHPGSVRTLAVVEGGGRRVVAGDGHPGRGDGAVGRRPGDAHRLRPFGDGVVVHRQVEGGGSASAAGGDGYPERIGEGGGEVLVGAFLGPAGAGAARRPQIHGEPARRGGFTRGQGGGDGYGNPPRALFHRLRVGGQGDGGVVVVDGERSGDHVEGGGRTGEDHRFGSFPAAVVDGRDDQLHRSAAPLGRDGQGEGSGAAVGVGKGVIPPGRRGAPGRGQGHRRVGAQPAHALPQSGGYRYRGRAVVLRHRQTVQGKHDVLGVVVHDGHRRLAGPAHRNDAGAGVGVDRRGHREVVRRRRRQLLVALGHPVVGHRQVEGCRPPGGAGGDGDGESVRRRRVVVV